MKNALSISIFNQKKRFFSTNFASISLICKPVSLPSFGHENFSFEFIFLTNAGIQIFNVIFNTHNKNKREEG